MRKDPPASLKPTDQSEHLGEDKELVEIVNNGWLISQANICKPLKKVEHISFKKRR